MDSLERDVVFEGRTYTVRPHHVDTHHPHHPHKPFIIVLSSTGENDPADTCLTAARARTWSASYPDSATARLLDEIFTRVSQP
jgi:hypothetical protein